MKLSERWRRFREIDNAMSEHVDISKKFPGYFHKPFFRGAVWIVALLALVVLIQTKAITFDFSEKEYWVCPDTAAIPCMYTKYTPGCGPHNPTCVPINMGLYPPGTVIGELPPVSVQYFPLFAILIFVLAFVANHVRWRYVRG